MLQARGIDVIAESDNGKELISSLKRKKADVVLMDIDMPVMNGLEATRWLTEHMPNVRVLVLSMYDDELHIIKMIRSGARGYLLKDADPSELMTAIREVKEKGFYHSDLVNGMMVQSIHGGSPAEFPGNDDTVQLLNPKERTFLQLVCTELGYKQIAEQMNASPRTIDGYRDALFVKLKVKTRVGLVIYAIRAGLVNPFTE